MRTQILGTIAILLTGCSSPTEVGDLPERVGDLSDRDIEQICEPVQRQVDLSCSTSEGEVIIEETPGSRDCIAALQGMREDEGQACMRTSDVVACQHADACEKYTSASDVCDYDCPEREECWTFSVADCPVNDGWCAVQTGQKFDAEQGCYRQTDAYCWPTNRTCSSALTTAIDADGACWLMSSICQVPDGWHNEDLDRSCPYDADLRCP